MNTKRGLGILAMVGVVAASSVAVAQQAQRIDNAAGGMQQSEGPTVPAGSELSARLMTTIGSKSSHEGDMFFANLLSPVTDESGGVLVPRGAKLVGRVDRAGRGHAFAPNARFAYSIIGVEKDGRYVPIVASVVNPGQSRSRGGIFLRPSATVHAGAVIGVRLDAPVSVAELRGGPTNQAIGGGPMR